jgi:hypothetical protein
LIAEYDKKKIIIQNLDYSPTVKWRHGERAFGEAYEI